MRDGWLGFCGMKEGKGNRLSMDGWMDGEVAFWVWYTYIAC